MAKEWDFATQSYKGDAPKPTSNTNEVSREQQEKNIAQTVKNTELINRGMTPTPSGWVTQEGQVAGKTTTEAIKNIKEFEQAPQQQNQFLNKITPATVAAQAQAADQAQMAAAIGLGTTGVPAEVSAAYASTQAFREKRAAQVAKGAKGTDVSYPSGVRSPLYSENITTAMTKGGSVFVGGVGGYEFKAPAPQIQPNGAASAPASTQLFSPMAQADINKFQTSREFAAAGAPGVVGGASLASGGYFSLVQTQQQPTTQTERKSIFKLEPAVNQYGNIQFRETAAGFAEYGAEKLMTILGPAFVPATSLIPKQIKEPIASFGKSLIGGAASGSILVSPFGLGEAVGTIGNLPKQQSLMVEFGGITLLGGVIGKALPLKTSIPKYQVSSTGYAPFSLKPTERLPSTRFTVEKSPAGFVARSTTDVPVGKNIVQGGRIVGEYAETGMVTRTVTPFTKAEGSFVKVQEVSQMPGKTKVQQFAIKLEETAPQRQFVASDATLFSMPKTFPLGTTLTSTRSSEGVLFRTGTGEFVSRTPTSDFATGGLFKPGQRIFVADEFGTVSGVSDVRVLFKEPPAGGKPGGGALFVAPGNYKVQISREFPKQTMGVPRDISTVQYSKVEAAKPIRVELPTKGGQIASQIYDVRLYDKPISAPVIEATIPKMAAITTPKASTGVWQVPTSFVKYAEAVAPKQATISKFDIRTVQTMGQPSAQRVSMTIGQPTISGTISGTFSPQITSPIQYQKQPVKDITAQIFPPTSIGFTTPMKIPTNDIPTYKPRIEIPAGIFPGMSGSSSYGKRTTPKKGAYRPSFIARELGIRGSPGKSEMTGFTIRPLKLAGKGKRR